jgi:parallel beta-helix repeat protein
MILSTIIPVSGIVLMEKTSHPLTKGNILYVGGSGPNNYTKIQDAVNASSNGDTVFVYDDSSPYVENIVIDTSISLIGEDKNTTIIDGAINGHGVNITADNVTVIGFTIQNCSNGSGICISSNNNRIADNIISNNMFGIGTYYGNPFEPPAFPSSGYNTITNNLIIRNEGGGIGLSGQNNTVNDNIISQTEYGIMLAVAVANNISKNIISENENGIFIAASYNNVIYRNNISHNEKLGVSNFCTSSDIILQNNFIGNGQNAYFNQPILTRFRILKNILNFPISRSVWDENYWDRPRMIPYMIPGLISLIRGPIIDAPYIFNYFQIDWHPAQEPYDIPLQDG